MFLRTFYLFLIFFIACGDAYEDESLSIFKYNEASGIYTLDPAFAKDQATIWAANQIYNGLVQIDNKLSVKPSISKNYTISSNNLIYTFFLRDDVYFHDHKIFKDSIGRRVVAADFEYSFSRLKDEKIASPGAWVLSNVDYFKAINDTTFQIHLIKPFPAFLSLLTMQYCSVLPKEIVESGAFNKHPIGTGPFKFQFWQPGTKLVFRRNPNYFEKENGNRLPYLDAVAITFVKDKQSAFLQFLQGNNDFISGLDASYKDELLNRDGNLREKYKNTVVLYSQPYLNTEYLGFLMDNSFPIEIRKAINYGFDRKKMIQYLRNNIGTPANQGFIPFGMPSFNENLNGYYYNPKKARELISESNFDLSKIIVLSTTSSYLDLCEYIQSQLEMLGFNIKIELNPPATHRQMVATSRVSFFRGSWIADYPEGENYLSLFYSKNFSPNGPNYTHFKDDNFDSLYEQSLSEQDKDKRIILYNQMDQIIIDSAVIVPLYYDKVLRFTTNKVSGLETNPMNLLDLKRVKKLSY